MVEYARVLVDLPAKIFDRPFDYLIPENLKDKVFPGVKVLVPFGKKKITGYVIEKTFTPEVKNVKPIFSVIIEEKLFNAEILELARWLADYYFCYLITALKTTLIFEEAFQVKRKVKKRESGFLTPLILKKISNKWIKKTLNNIDFTKHDKFLIYGNNRLSFYFKLIEAVIKRKKNVIFLLPEEFWAETIFYTFKKKFGSQIALFKSSLPKNLKKQIFDDIKNKKIKIIIGTRSAIFTPFENIGLIVVDQEENLAFKQEKNPRYHTLKVAEKRANYHQSLLIFGSNSPSLETYHRVKTGEIKIIKLPLKPKKINFSVIDLNLQKEKKGRKFSRLIPLEFQNEVAHSLLKKKPVLVFLNRLGYYTIAFCKNCSTPLTCPECQRPLAFNNFYKKFICYKCRKNFENLVCNNCSENQFIFKGLGIERIVKELKKLFPASNIIQLERKTFKNSFYEILKELKKEANSIFVSTKVGLKLGTLFKFNVIGFFGFDSFLNFPDFRAEERLFQLLSQFFSDYFKEPKNFMIFTHHPDHPILQSFLENYEKFYEKELLNRKELLYPPFSSLAILEIISKDKSKIQKITQNLNSCKEGLEIKILEVKELKKKNVLKILFKIFNQEQFKNYWEKFSKTLESGIKINLDVDPLEMF